MTQPIELSPERREAFLAEAAANGIPVTDAENVLKIITVLAPPLEAKAVEAIGMPLGETQYRVAREYDGEIAASLGEEGWSDIVVHTQLGTISLTVNRAALVQALTVEVPYVAPKKAPQQS